MTFEEISIQNCLKYYSNIKKVEASDPGMEIQKFHIYIQYVMSSVMYFECEKNFQTVFARNKGCILF